MHSSQLPTCSFVLPTLPTSHLLLTSTSHFNLRTSPLQTSNVRLPTFAGQPIVRLPECHNPAIPCCGFATARAPSPASACCSPSSTPGRSRPIPATLSRNDNADAQLNEWILAWVAHQLPRAPAHLFDGNIFYPARDTLAFSEPLIVPALMGAPLHWLGASPVLVFNIVLMLGFALTAWAGYAVAYEWTGDRAAGMLAGSMFAFNTHTLTRLAHVQGIHAGDCRSRSSRPIAFSSTRAGATPCWLAVWMTAMAYTSGYLIVFGAIMVGGDRDGASRGLVGAAWTRRDARLPARPCCRRSPSCPCTCPTVASPELGMVRPIDNGRRVLGQLERLSRQPPDASTSRRGARVLAERRRLASSPDSS